jgi:PTS system nitrogen regulatory IIA component
MTEGDILTLEEVAKYLRVSGRTVYDWAQKGEIPAGKIGTVWRFKKEDIEAWVDRRLSPGRFAGEAPREAPPLGFETLISPDRILFLGGSAKREILRREELMSTAIGGGIAIPHVRLPSVTDLVVSLGICRAGVGDFQALDDEPVRLVFMIAAAYNQHDYYLRALSFFSARLKDPGLRRELLSAQSPGEARRLLLDSGQRSLEGD